MSQPSTTYLRRIEQWLMGGISLERMNMSIVQRYRAKLVYEAYQVWMQDHMIDPTDLLRRIAAREYAISLKQARFGDEKAVQDVQALNIREGVPRSINEISNDVYVLNWMVKRFATSTRDIDKAKVLSSADWLMKTGKAQRNDRAVTSGAKILMDIYQNFNEKENPADEMPSTDINITGDVTIVDSTRTNLSDEERKRLERKYNLTPNEVRELKEQEDGSYAVVDNEEENEQSEQEA